MENKTLKTKGRFYKRGWFWCILIVLAILLNILLNANYKNDKEISLNQSTPKDDQPLLELQSYNCSTEYDYFIIEGSVKNISDKSLDDVEAVGSAYQDNDEFVKSDSSLIKYNPILSGQISPFRVIMTGNPLIKKCSVSFKELLGGTIFTKKL